jgi:hypothetical protein
MTAPPEILGRLRCGTLVDLELGDGEVITGWFQGVEADQVQLEIRFLPPGPEHRQIPLDQVENVWIVSRAERERL